MKRKNRHGLRTCRHGNCVREGREKLAFLSLFSSTWSIINLRHASLFLNALSNGPLSPSLPLSLTFTPYKDCPRQDFEQTTHLLSHDRMAATFGFCTFDPNISRVTGCQSTGSRLQLQSFCLFNFTVFSLSLTHSIIHLWSLVPLVITTVKRTGDAHQSRDTVAGESIDISHLFNWQRLHHKSTHSTSLTLVLTLTTLHTQQTPKISQEVKY